MVYELCKHQELWTRRQEMWTLGTAATQALLAQRICAKSSSVTALAGTTMPLVICIAWEQEVSTLSLSQLEPAWILLKIFNRLYPLPKHCNCWASFHLPIIKLAEIFMKVEITCTLAMHSIQQVKAPARVRGHCTEWGSKSALATTEFEGDFCQQDPVQFFILLKPCAGRNAFLLWLRLNTF